MSDSADTDEIQGGLIDKDVFDDRAGTRDFLPQSEDSLFKS